MIVTSVNDNPPLGVFQYKGEKRERSWVFNIVEKRLGFSGGSAVKNSLPVNAGDSGSIPGSGRSHGEGNGHAFQYSCLGNPTDRGAGWAGVHGVTKRQTQLSD